MLGKKMLALAIGALASTSFFGGRIVRTDRAPLFCDKNPADDFARIAAAEEKRARKNAKRLKDAGQ